MTAEEDLRREADRVVDRLRTMPLARLAASAPGARALAQGLADRSADLAGQQRREVPDVGDAAVGDQVAVMVADLLALRPPPQECAGAAEEIARYRRAL